MPAYTLNGVVVLYFAAWKSHYSLYPASDALVEAFARSCRHTNAARGRSSSHCPSVCEVAIELADANSETPSIGIGTCSPFVSL